MERTHGGRTALVLLDLMPVIVPELAGDAELLHRLATASVDARQVGVDVVHVRVAFRAGYPDLAPANKVFAAFTSHFDLTDSNPGTDIHPSLGRQDSDIVVLKKRVSAFAGSDLDIVLRSREVTALVLAGVTTSGAVLSTLRAAADLDYELTVLSDGCADTDAAVHELLLSSVFPMHAHVVATADWVTSLHGVG